MKWFDKHVSCVILCAGRGMRMGGDTPKVLLKVGGKALVDHVIDFWKPYTNDFIFVVGHERGKVMDYLDKYVKQFGSATFIPQLEQRGIAHAISLVKKHVADRFVVALGDCLQVGHFRFPDNMEIGIGVLDEAYRRAMCEGYVAECTNKTVVEVKEKPPVELCGMGTYFFNRLVFSFIRLERPSPLRNEVEITDVIQSMIEAREKVSPVLFSGQYINVTYPEDLIKAEEVVKCLK